jgi:hypothetical protein
MLQAPMAGSSEVYLGVPLEAAKPNHFQNILDKVDSSLQPWQTQFLSHAGKLLLIRSVIESIINYTMSTMDIPVLGQLFL